MRYALIGSFVKKTLKHILQIGTDCQNVFKPHLYQVKGKGKSMAICEPPVSRVTPGLYIDIVPYCYLTRTTF